MKEISWASIMRKTRPGNGDCQVQSNVTEMMHVAELMDDHCRCYPHPSAELNNQMNTQGTVTIRAVEQILSQLIECLQKLC